MKTLFRIALLVVIVIAVGGFLMGWWAGHGDMPSSRDEVGTTGVTVAERAREASGALAERASEAAGEARDSLEDGALTAKIKSKITLDDTLDGSRIDVDTAGDVVTLHGTVVSEAQRQRALQLARETDGVRKVVDKLMIGPRGGRG